MALSVTSTTPTGWAADAAKNNFNFAQGIANKPFQPYNGNMLAGWTDAQAQGYNTVLGNAQNNTGLGAMQAGQNAAQGAAAFQAQPVQAWAPQSVNMTPTATQAASAGPAAQAQAFDTGAAYRGPASMMGAATMNAANAGPAAQAQAAAMQAAQSGPAAQMQAAQMAAASAGPAAQMTAAQAQLAQMQAAAMNRGDVRNVASQNFTDANLGAYMNPYTSSVIDASMNQLSRRNDLINQATNARAAAAGAFGGSRQAVANSENNRAYLDTAAQTIAGLNNSNFAQAQSAIQTDQQRALNAQLANQQQDWNVGNLNTSNRQAAAQQNMLASNQMSQYNASNRQNASQWNAGATNQQNQYNAGLTQAANLQNSNLQQDASARNMGALNDRSALQAQLQQQANQTTAGFQQQTGLQNMAATNDRTALQAQLQQQALANNQQTAQQAMANNQAAQNAMETFNAGNAQRAAEASAAARNQASLYNTGQANNMAQYNASNQQSAFNQSAAAENNANAANQAAYNNMSQNNAELALRAGLGNQQAAQSAANTRLAGANALNGMGLDQQQHQFNQANALMGAGGAYQAQQQAALDNQYNQWAAQQNHPLTQLGVLQSGLNGYSSGQQQVAPGASSNTMANVLAGGLGIGSALYNAPQLISGGKAAYSALSGLLGGGGATGNGALGGGLPF